MTHHPLSSTSETAALWRAWALALALAWAAWCLQEDAQPDLYFHLAAGRWMWEHGAVPRSNVFLAQCRDHPFTDPEWLGQALAWPLHALGGVRLLSLLKTGLVAAVAALGALTLRRAGGARAGLLLLLPLVCLAGPRFVLRPELFSLLGVAAHLALLLGRRGPPTRRVTALLLGTQVLWANLHGFAFLGPALVLAALVAALACPVSRAAAPRLAALLGLELVASCLGPYGLAGALYGARAFSAVAAGGQAAPRVRELISPLAAEAGGRLEVELFRVWLALALPLVGVGLAGRRLQLRALLMGLGLTATAVPYARNLPFAGLGLALISAPGLGLLLRRGARLPIGVRRGLLGGGVVVVLLFARETAGGRYHDNAEYDARPGLGAAPFPRQDEAVAFLERDPPPGELFNTFAAGQFLSLARPAGRLPFINGNLDLYPPEHLARYHRWLDAGQEPDGLDRLTSEADAADISDLILDHRSEAPGLLVARLAADARWTLVHADPHAVVFRRATRGGVALEPSRLGGQALERRYPDEDTQEAAPFPLLRALGLLPSRGVRPLERLHLARLLDLLGASPSALELARAASRLAADHPAVLAERAELERRGGDREAAGAAYRRWAELVPAAHAPWVGLGLLELAAGRPRPASEAFARAIARDPTAVEAHANLLASCEAAADPVGLRRALAAAPGPAVRPALRAFYTGAASLLEEEFARARGPLAEAARLEPGNVVFLDRLAEAAYGAGDLEAAEAAFRGVCELTPNDLKAWRDLGSVRYARGESAGAREAWERAANLDVRETLSLVYQAQLEVEQGDAGRAQALLREALRRDPGAPGARKLLRILQD